MKVDCTIDWKEYPENKPFSKPPPEIQLGGGVTGQIQKSTNFLVIFERSKDKSRYMQTVLWNLNEGCWNCSPAFATDVVLFAEIPPIPQADDTDFCHHCAQAYQARQWPPQVRHHSRAPGEG